MKRPLLFAAFLFTMINCGAPASQSGEPQSPSQETLTKVDELLLQEDIDTNDDGEISKEEKKVGLDNLGQKIKAAIAAKHEEMRAAQEVSKDKIKEACADDHSSEACKAAAQAERDKLREEKKDLLAALQKELDELKAVLMEVETENESL